MKRKSGIMFIALCSILLILFAFAVRADGALSDTQNLAVLAANMLLVAEDSEKDYAMDCGPIDEVLNTAPLSGIKRGKYYCVLHIFNSATDKQVVFGTFTAAEDSKTAGLLILDMYKDIMYDAQIAEPDDIDENACDSLDAGAISFQECKNAIQNLRTYAYDTSLDDGGPLYVIVSEEEIDIFDSEGFFTNTIEFFSELFGISGETEVISSTDDFHHSFYTKQADRKITGQWKDTDAVLVYENFVTDLTTVLPRNAEYDKGKNNKQLLLFDDLHAGDDDKVRQWRQYTSGLRIKDVEGTPIAGAVCGDEITDYDEQCDLKAGATDAGSCRKDHPDADELNFVEGILGCYPASDTKACQFDITNCVSCSDTDGDGYSGGVGSSGALAILTSNFMLGASSLYGPYVDDDDAQVLQKTIKQEIGVTLETIPVVYDLAFPPGSSAERELVQALAAAKTKANSCATDDAVCKKGAYSNDDNKFTAVREAMMSNLLKPFPEAQPCTINGVLTCPDGYSPNAIGIPKDKPYGKTDSTAGILQMMKSDDVSPLIRITLGSCADNNCGPYGYAADASATWKVDSGLPTKASYTNDELLRIRVYCYLVAEGVGGYWGQLDTPDTPTAKIKQFLVIGDPQQAGIDDTEGKNSGGYDAVYQYCKQGIEDAIGTAAVVLYGAPATPTMLDDRGGASRQLSSYLQTVRDDPRTYDGLYIEPPIYETEYKTMNTINEFKAWLDPVTAIGVPIYVRASIPQQEPTLSGAVLPLYSLLSGARALMYDTVEGTRPFSNIHVTEAENTGTEEWVNDPTTATPFWKKAMAGMKGTLFFLQELPDGTAVPENVYVIMAKTEEGKTTMTIYNLNTAETLFDPPLSACALASVVKTTKAGSAEPTTAFDEKLPALSITTLLLDENPTCLSPDDARDYGDACGAVVDCNDDDSDTYPGAPESCDKIDNDCNDVVDDACQDDEVTNPEGIVCDYDNICEAGGSGGEDVECPDCTQHKDSCPTNWKKVGTQKTYEFYVRKGPADEQELLVVNIGDSKSGTSEDCDMVSGSDPDNRYLVKQKHFKHDAGTESILYYNGGNDKFAVVVRAESDKWIIDGVNSYDGSTMNGDATYSSSCWGCTDKTCLSLDLNVPIARTSTNAELHCELGAVCAIPDEHFVDEEDCCNCLIADSTSTTCKAPDPLGCYSRDPEEGDTVSCSGCTMYCYKKVSGCESIKEGCSYDQQKYKECIDDCENICTP